MQEGLNRLLVVHQNKLADPILENPPESWGDPFFIETCQRKLWVFFSKDPIHTPEIPFKPFGKLEFYLGESAYRFLLEVTTGLASDIKGETNIFGQIKESWEIYTQKNLISSQHLKPWIKNIFEDAKEIRTLYLQNVSSGSYGSLVRKILKQKTFISQLDSLTLFGAGQLGRSIAPYLQDLDVKDFYIWNRSKQTGLELVSSLTSQTVKFVTEFPEKTTLAVICIPAHSDGDHKIASYLDTMDDPFIVHLGWHPNQTSLTTNCSYWEKYKNIFTLEDLFLEQKNLSLQTQALFAQAHKACLERSKLRALPGSQAGSIHLHHGWEDLAAF